MLISLRLLVRILLAASPPSWAFALASSRLEGLRIHASNDLPSFDLVSLIDEERC